MGNLDMKILESYHLEIEKISELIPHVIFPNIEGISEDEIFWIRVEYFSQTALVEGSIVEMFEGKKNEVTEYLTERIANTSNVIMKAKYNNFIFILTKNNSYCQGAIEYYQQALTSAFKDTNKEYYELRVKEIFERVLEMSNSIKYRLVELKKQIAGYLCDDTITDRLKTRLFLSVKEQNIFTAKESENFPPFFVGLAQSTSDHLWVEHNLNIALFFASKVQNQQQLQTIYELFGDNELKGIFPGDNNNLAVPHMNERVYEKAIDYYKKAKCEQKLMSVYEQHCKNRKNKRYISVPIEAEVSKDFIDALNKLLEEISNMPPRAIAANLILCKHFLFIPNEKIEEAIKNKETYFYEQFFTPVQVDINANHKKTDADENNKFQYYDFMMRRNTDFILRSIFRCIQKKKLSFRKLYNTLSRYTTFGKELTKDYNGTLISYTWLSMIDVGLESFFEQCRRMLNGKSADWRVCIDVLAPKFEGILRDILEMNGANVVNFNSCNTEFYTLERFIRLGSQDMKDAFYKSFDDDDLNLFQYIFSSIAQCENIRNNVSHCYYIPQDYTPQKALLVVLGVLRLAKFVPRND